ncbi:lysosomal acid phosphatase-like protein [Euroglyphus maynei]|uniref:Lysosomal acid phosphatase-like protein n=1 Tax=Euroglyphus maynei TaxID=6958 RepID=A0A1Y3AL31_EURMA|nr:lysosomal acid phosphatase-like protein [Euroglyphus maynei]
MKSFMMIFFTWPLFWLQSTMTVHCSNDDDDHVNVDTLKLVILIHRHGDRTPIETYPRDPYHDEQKYWPDGWGQLTLNGKNRMYNLGLYLSKRYGQFLGKTPHEVYIRSSASDRCLESVSLILASLYPPVGRWKWNDNFGQKWQPFPIQTVPHDNDGMLNPSSKCKKAEQIRMDIFKSEPVINYYDQMKSTLLYVQDNTGYKNVDLIKAEQIFDSLLIEKMNDYKLPAWVDMNVFEKLKDISAKTFIFSGMTKQIQRFRTGLLLSDIWQHISDDNDERRLYIYSTHDDQLSVFMSALKNFNGLSPPFGATIMIEIHRQQNHTIINNEPFIRMYYLNVTEMEKPYPLELNNCKRIGSDHDHCTISNFYESIKDLIPDDWDAECENPSSSSRSISADRMYFIYKKKSKLIFILNPSTAISIYLLLVTISLTLLVMLFFIYLILNHRRFGSSYRLLPINS